MLKATEDLKLQQKKRAEERQIVLSERIPTLPSDLENELLILSDEYRGRIIELESEIYDLSYINRKKDFEINELTIAVNDLRGKFVKPTLKRISKTDSQLVKKKIINFFLSINFKI
ncbi:hypothetical protein Mgra_00007055 [Meloidogyne graminicola]|uniref:Uncharacterized protein n=1 Tax=Meloidogyne graminicola TaxID=189291 RepID=A0A8S9ZJT7_9BILA|nr:hypothetical protein Mgra_00007055 [Meloidogyne graminicola]